MCDEGGSGVGNGLDSASTSTSVDTGDASNLLGDLTNRQLGQASRPGKAKV